MDVNYREMTDWMIDVNLKLNSEVIHLLWQKIIYPHVLEEVLVPVLQRQSIMQLVITVLILWYQVFLGYHWSFLNVSQTTVNIKRFFQLISHGLALRDKRQVKHTQLHLF